MAEPLVVRIPHKLGKEEALRRVKPALDKASSSFPVLAVEEETWSGDRLSFRVRALGQVAAGNVEVAEDHVQLEVTLPWLLHKFAQVVQQAAVAFSSKRNNSAALLAAATPASEKRPPSRCTRITPPTARLAPSSASWCGCRGPSSSCSLRREKRRNGSPDRPRHQQRR